MKANRNISLFEMTTLPIMIIQQHWLIITGKTTDGIIMSLVMNSSFPNYKLLRVSDQKLADAIGTDRQTIRRARKRLSSLGLVTTIRSGSPLIMTYIPNLQNIEAALNSYFKSTIYKSLQQIDGSYEGINAVQINYINMALQDSNFQPPDTDEWNAIRPLWNEIEETRANTPNNVNIANDTYHGDTLNEADTYHGDTYQTDTLPVEETENDDSDGPMVSNDTKNSNLLHYYSVLDNYNSPENNKERDSKVNNGKKAPINTYDMQKPINHYLHTEEPYLLASLLMELRIANVPGGPRNDPEKKEHLIQLWADSMRLMVEKDHWSKEKIASVIEWSQTDPFWAGNILCGEKLREKMDILTARMSQTAEESIPRDIYPEITHKIIVRFENKFLGGVRNEWPAKDQIHFIEASKRAMDFARSTRLKEENMPKYLIDCANDFYIENDHGSKNVFSGHLAADLMWVTLIPEYLKQLGIGFKKKVKK